MFQKISGFHLWLSRALMFIGVGCFIVGIVSHAIGTMPGMKPTDWLIMTAAVWALSVWSVLMGLAESIKE